MNIKIFSKREETQVNMMDVVIGFLSDKTDIVALNLGFKDAVDEVKPLVADLKTIAPLGAVSTVGITAGKNNSKTTLCEKTARFAGLISAYAEKTGDTEMQTAVSVSKSELKQMRDGEIALRCQTILDLGAAHQAALADYGINNHKITELQAAIDVFNQTAQKPRAAITDRTVIKAQVKAKLAKALNIFKKRLDLLIEDYADTHPEFAAAYKEKRKIVDPKTIKPKDTDSGGNAGANGGNENGGGTTPA